MIVSVLACDFSGALKAIKQGKKASRQSWTSPQSYIVMKKQDIDVDGDGQVDEITPYIAIHKKDANGKCVESVWVPTMEDLFATDWVTRV